MQKKKKMIYCNTNLYRIFPENRPGPMDYLFSTNPIFENMKYLDFGTSVRIFSLIILPQKYVVKIKIKTNTEMPR